MHLEHPRHVVVQRTLQAVLLRDHMSYPLVQAPIGVGDVLLQQRHRDRLLAREVLIQGAD